MFIKKSSVDEIAEALKVNLTAQEIIPELQKKAAKDEAVELLLKASERLDEAGLEKQAAKLLKLVKKVSWSVPKNDPHHPNSSEQMTKNLKEKGWVFNADDGKVEDTGAGRGPKGLTNDPHSKDLSTGIAGPKMVDSLGPGQPQHDFSLDDDGKDKDKEKKAPAPQPDPEKPFQLPGKQEPAVTPVEPVGWQMPPAEPLK